MKFAYYPGCSAKGTCPELHKTTKKIANLLEMELVELEEATCCGAGVIQEKNRDVGNMLNLRTLSMAEDMGLDIMTICGTCQGHLGGLNKELKENDKLWDRLTPMMEEAGLQYRRSIEVKHMLWWLSEEKGLNRLKSKLVKPLKGMKIAPFYGCHILRPSEHLGFDDPEKPGSLEKIITALGATVIEHPNTKKCCGFPIVIEKEQIALSMVGNILKGAKENGANCIVTPCPLCHMNLDIYQEKSEDKMDASFKMPILHFPQLIAMALGASNRDIQTSRHLVSTDALNGWVTPD